MARMQIEHGMANDALAKCRTIAMDYNLPSDACKAYTTLYQGLAKLETLISEHTQIQEQAVHPRITELAAQ
jgi:iron-sulfur cluster repair protein YtfE (RIC family)